MGAPYETNGQQKTGDVYKCPVTSDTHSNCTKLNLGTAHPRGSKGELGIFNMVLFITALVCKDALCRIAQIVPKSMRTACFRRIFR